MKKALLIAALSLPALVFGQIKYQKLSFDEAKALAAKEGKQVFVDVCRTNPPKAFKDIMGSQKQIFSDKELSKFMKDNFIAIQVDMSNKENFYFAENLNSLMYPCICFYTNKGVQLEAGNWSSVAKDPSMIKKIGEKSLADAKIKAANSRQINFSDISFEEAIAKAKKENKLVFIDAYTSWCRPCKQMQMHVFTLDKVADFYNDNFICVKYDFHKDRPDLAKRFGVKGFPGYIFVNGDTVQVHQDGGFQEADKFISQGEKALKYKDGIAFEQTAWADIVAKAKAENKPIFMDCYTSWCGPCKKLAATVFKDPKVAAVMNEKFINAKFDMEKGEGIDLKNQFEVSAFPTLLFISPEGEVQHKILGSMSSDKFLAEAQTSLDGKGLITYLKKYQAGQRDTAFLFDYIDAVSAAYMKKEITDASVELLNIAGNEGLKDPKVWKIYADNISDYESPYFTYLLANKDALAAIHGDKAVDRKIAMVWGNGYQKFLTQNNKVYSFDQKGFAKYISMLKGKNVNNWKDIEFNGLSTAALMTENWTEYYKLINSKILADKENKLSLMELYNWILRVDQKCKDQSIRTKTAKWVDKAIALAQNDNMWKSVIPQLEKMKTTLQGA